MPIPPAQTPSGMSPEEEAGTLASNPGRGALANLASSVLIDREYARLWTGQAISGIGDSVFSIALVLYVAAFIEQGQVLAPVAVSGVILAAAVPEILVGPIAGVFVDRWDKRRTMLHMNGLQAMLAALLVVAIGARLPAGWKLGVIYADIALITVCYQFFNPSQYALIKDLVPDARQDQALETTQATTSLAQIFGPPLAAGLVFTLGVQWALLLDALSFVVSFLAIQGIEAPQSASSLRPGERGHFGREFLDGLRYVLGHAVLRTILISIVLTWLGFGALEALGYFFLTQNLHAPASSYGYLGATFGIGAVVGAVLVTTLGQRIGLARILWVALVTSGTFVIVLSHLTSFSLVLVAAFLFGVSATSIIVTAGPLALHGTSREFVGRVMAAINPIGRFAALISVAAGGSLVSTVLHNFHASVLGIHFGPVNSVLTGMGLLAVAGGVFARIHLHGAIREADRERAQARQLA
jgi:MFS family permease